jgi:hypothetical protein
MASLSTRESQPAVSDRSQADAEALGRVFTLVHATMRRLAGGGDIARRREISAEFLEQIEALCSELQTRYGLAGPDADAVVSEALACAGRLLEAEIGNVPGGEEIRRRLLEPQGEQGD